MGAGHHDLTERPRAHHPTSPRLSPHTRDADLDGVGLAVGVHRVGVLDLDRVAHRKVDARRGRRRARHLRVVDFPQQPPRPDDDDATRPRMTTTGVGEDDDAGGVRPRPQPRPPTPRGQRGATTVHVPELASGDRRNTPPRASSQPVSFPPWRWGSHERRRRACRSTRAYRSSLDEEEKTNAWGGF